MRHEVDCLSIFLRVLLSFEFKPERRTPPARSEHILLYARAGDSYSNCHFFSRTFLLHGRSLSGRYMAE